MGEPAEILNNKSNLEELEGKSEDLMLGAFEYDKLGKDLKRKIMMERMKVVVFLVVAGVVGFDYEIAALLIYLFFFRS